MKKTFVSVVLLSGLLLTACSSSESVKETVEKVTEKTEQVAEQSASSEAVAKETPTYGIGQDVKVGDVVYKVNSKELSTNVGGEFGKNANGTFVVLNVTVTNQGKEALMVDSNFFTLLKGDVKFDADSSAGIYANEDANFFLTNLNPENSVTGNVVFDVSPETANDPSIQLQVQTGFWGTETAVINLQ